jgi:acyl-CoA synthetase (AMP-forming)/AMP-acid ligase II
MGQPKRRRRICSIPRFGSLIDYHLENNGSLVYADIAPRDGQPPVTVTYRELAEAVHRFGRQLLANVGDPKTVDGVDTVVAILAPSDGLIYATLFLAILRAGYVVRATPLDEEGLRAEALAALSSFGPELVRCYFTTFYSDYLSSRSRTCRQQ